MSQSNPIQAPTPQTTELIEPPLDPSSLVEVWCQIAEEAGAAGADGQAEILAGCARQLADWIRYEGIHAVMCMPPTYIRLIHAAMAYDPTDETRVDDLQELCMAACAMKGMTQ